MPRENRVYLRSDTLWNMRIDHPYSLGVVQGKTGWSGGQCPLDREGKVLSPGDLVGQVRDVSRIIKQILQDAGYTPAQVVKLVVYHVDQGAGSLGRSLDVLRREFGQAALLVPVSVPHFYYDDMLVEIDFHMSEAWSERSEHSSGGNEPKFEVVHGSELSWMRLLIPRTGATDAIPVAKQCEDLLGNGRRLLVDNWYVGGAQDMDLLLSFQNAGLCSDAGAAVQLANSTDWIQADFTFADPGDQNGDAQQDLELAEGFGRTIGDFFWICGRAEGLVGGIVPQTETIMKAIERRLVDLRLDFGAVCKATTLYTGSAAADDLHDNMKVRNRYYSRPGPSSTGLPVEAFPLSSCSITVSVLGRCS